MTAPHPTSIKHPGPKPRVSAELNEARTALASAARQRARLDRAIIEAVDQERRQLAQILHDTVCQSLSGMSLLCRTVIRKLEAASSTQTGEIAELGQALTSAGAEIHGLVRRLRPADADSPDLVSSLANVSASISQAVPCELESPEMLVLEDRFATTQLVQIAHQAANDALLRPGVKRITLSLSVRDRHISLTVRDDGGPADGESATAGSQSLEMIRLRASAIGATLTSSYQPLRGTTILCRLPEPR